MVRNETGVARVRCDSTMDRRGRRDSRMDKSGEGGELIPEWTGVVRARRNSRMDRSDENKN